MATSVWFKKKKKEEKKANDGKVESALRVQACPRSLVTLYDEVCLLCLTQVKDRKLKSLPPKPPDPHEQLLQDIRAQPKLKPVKDGRLVGKFPGTSVCTNCKRCGIKTCF